MSCASAGIGQRSGFHAGRHISRPGCMGGQQALLEISLVETRRYVITARIPELPFIPPSAVFPGNID